MREKTYWFYIKEGVLVFALGIFITFLLNSFIVFASNNVVSKEYVETSINKLKKNSVNSNFKIDDNNVLRKYNGSEKQVVIPFGVTKIGSDAFKDCKSLVSIKIPDSVTSIGSDAFYGCNSLINIEIPNGVTSIGAYTFYKCSSLTNVIIPNGVTSIGDYAFAYCTSLVGITIPDSVISIGDASFSDCDFLTSIIIPNSVTSIGDSAFAGCDSLTSVKISDSITLIERALFLCCPSLTDIKIPNNVTSIGKRAFYGCSSLANIEIPNGVTSIEESAFSYCGFTTIKIPNSVTSIGEGVFFRCLSLTNIKIPDSVTLIGRELFSGCSSLTNIKIPNSITSIGDKAFYGCSSLVNIEIPNSVTSIGRYMFTNLINIVIPDSVTSISDYAFYYSKEVTIYCNPFSNAELYAKLHNIKFRPVDSFGIDVGINNYEKAVENYISVVNSRIKAMLTNHKKMKTKSDKLDEQMIQNIKKKYKISEQYKINGKSKINKISSNERKELETAYWNALYHFTTDNIVEKIDFGDIEASKPIESQTKIVKAVDKYVRNLLKKVNYSTKYKNYNITITTSIAGNYKMVCQDKNGKSYNFYVTISPSYAEEITKDYIEKCIELEISIINSVEIGYLEEASKVLTGYDGIVSWSKSKLEKKVNTTLKKHGLGDINLALGKYYKYFNYVQKLQKNSSSKEYLKTLKIIYKNADKYLYNSDKITDIVIDDAVDKINEEIKKLKLEAKKALYK